MKQSEFLEIIELSKGKHRPSLETLILGRNGILRDPLPVVIATDDTNLPLMNIARTYGWIKQDATEFYESEAKNVTNITGEITNTFVNTHTQETLDTQYGTFTLDLWHDKDENKWYDTTELMGGGDFTLTNASFDTISPIKSQDSETAKLYEQIDWTNIEHFDEFKYFTSVTSIDDGVFAKCDGLTSITIPDSVTFIDVAAFDNCTNLTSITIPDSVTSISGSAFYGCSSLTSVTIPDSVTSIGSGAFNGCTGLTSVTINSNYIISNNYTAPYYDTMNYVFGEQVQEYIIGNNVTSIGNYVFYQCSGLTSVTIGNSVTSIGEGAFQGCSSLSNVIIPDSVTSIAAYSFIDCSSLIEVVIPNNVTSIGYYAFFNCTSLTSVTIGNSVTSIDVAFIYCNNLVSITSNATTAPTIKSSTFQNVKRNGTLIVPTGSNGYDTWMGTGNYYLGKYNWTKVEQ